MPGEVALSLAARRAVTPEKYAAAWRLIAAGCTQTQVMHGSGLTRAQLRWLMTEGDPDNGMPPYAAQLLDQVAELRGQAQTAARELGAEAVLSLRRQSTVAMWAQNLLHLLLQEFGREVSDNMKKPAGQRKGLHLVVPTRQVTETIKALTPLADFTRVAAAFRTTFGGSGAGDRDDPVSALPREARLDFGVDSLVPASLSMLQGERAGPGGDPLTDLLPESAGWTDEEAEHFANTGERPQRDFK